MLPSRPTAFACLGATLATVLAVTPAIPAPAPAAGEAAAELFFKPLLFQSLELSPSGRFVAAVATVHGSHNLVIIDLGSKQSVMLTAYTPPADVAAFHWKSDERLIYELRTTPTRSGNAVVTLTAVNRDGSNSRFLGSGDDSLVDLRTDDARTVLLSGTAEKPFYPSVYAVDVIGSGRPIKVTTAPGRNCRYGVDIHGIVRTCLSFEADLSRTLWYREADGAPWRALRRFTDQNGAMIPLGFTPDGKNLYVASNDGRDTSALFEWDPVTRDLGKLLFEAPGVDISGPIYGADGRSLLGVTYVTDSRHVHYIDPAAADLQSEIEKDFPGYRVGIVNRSADGRRAVVLVGNSQTPGKFYLYDAATATVSFVADRAPWIDPKAMAEVRAVTYRARDGVEINGYLTLPPGRPPKGLPLIVNPHGGPFFIRTVDGWNPDAQFFASRGYAVLQVNFRGSGGYGSTFAAAGFQEWGGKMQDDVTDGVAWAVDQGIVDRGRIAIFGVSYGGYAALMGLINTPELYRCGISYSGLSDLTSLFDGWVRANNLTRERPREELNYWRKVVGHASDGDYLRSRSPVYNVDKIRVPVFIAHGVDDMVIPYGTAQSLRDALKNKGNQVEFFSRPDEGHGFRKEANNVALFAEIDRFLQGCNPSQ